jgi:hypothetical protein
MSSPITLCDVSSPDTLCHVSDTEELSEGEIVAFMLRAGITKGIPGDGTASRTFPVSDKALRSPSFLWLVK